MSIRRPLYAIACETRIVYHEGALLAHRLLAIVRRRQVLLLGLGLRLEPHREGNM